ncbi:MFS general substrate transporter [Dendrothele bispora CBS 962.96]|uniref:MFS general substrate transporter n=1 Tax=Dendrothele bispora (strain CBS 962.96) TaxID=1314807 RepID=A0A4S8M8T6_DENBC|nr:MFS general substrate transporter [Dendrothele bispora CBS 962.96]
MSHQNPSEKSSALNEAEKTHTDTISQKHPDSLDPEQNSSSGEGCAATTKYEIDPIAEAKLLRKLDLVIIPLFTLIYCTNFIDRTAIGNANIAGIQRDLGMTGFDYNIALTVFYIFYIASEIPSNLILKRLGSSWISFMVFSFGIVSIGTAFVQSYGGLIATRIFLGICEGGTLSGLVYLMARYYRRSEIVLRVGIFFGLAPSLAGAFGGLLASGLLSLPDFGSSSGRGHITSWRKIFLIEGIITTFIGLSCFLILPNDPRHTRLFTPEERRLALARLDADQAIETQGKKEKTTWKLIGRGFNVNTIICSILYLLVNISFQGLSLFMPTVISTLGHFTTVESQLRTVPPYLVGAVWAIICSYTSFRINKRAPVLLFSLLLMVIGYAMAVGTKNSQARYAACFLSIMGGSNTGPMFLAWGTGNAAPDTVKAVVTAIIPGIGALGSVIAVWTYLPTDAPNYRDGNSLNLGTSSLGCLLVIIGWIYIRWENAKRERGERDYRLEGKSPKEIEELGYLHPGFRYQT